MNADQLVASSQPFLTWLVRWYKDRPSLELSQILKEVNGKAAKIAVLAVDVTSGFCSEGPLASERVGGIVEPIARLFERAGVVI